jgi:hypothetical protein
VNRKVLAAGLMIGGALAVGACSQTGAVDRGQLESTVKTKLEAVAHQKAKDVTCPDNLDAEVKATTRCTLQAMDGSEIGVTVTVTSVKGDTVNFHVEADQSARP